MADRSARARRRRRRRLVAGIGVVAVAAGGGVAWATRGSDGPSYRYATVSRGDLTETVDADGHLASPQTSTLSFASSGTVTSVAVRVGQKVVAGQTVATIDDTDLLAAVTDAQATVSRAQQTLSDDETAQANGTTVTTAAITSFTGTVTGPVAASAVTANSGGIVLAAKVTPTGIASAQAAVVAAQHALDAALTAQDAAVSALITACAPAAETTAQTTAVLAGSDGTVSGTAGSSASVVTLRTSGGDVAQSSSANPQRVAAGGSWSFGGLDPGTHYSVAVIRADVISTDACVAAAGDVQDGEHAVDNATATLDTALTALERAIAAAGSTAGSGSGTGGSGGGGSGGSGSGGGGSGGAPGTPRPSGSTTGSGSTTRSTSTGRGATGARTGDGASTSSGTGSPTGNAPGAATLVTPARIAADARAVDAAQAQLDVARHAVSTATLTTPIAGTVAAVGLTKGASVGARSSTQTVTVVGTGELTVDLSIGIADIDKIAVGQRAEVTVDGHQTPYPAAVTVIGVLDSSSSGGSSAAYPVTVRLDAVQPSLLDGMGAQVSIAVGAAHDVLTVPLSAVHSIGTRHTVVVADGTRATTTTVTLGVTGTDQVQVKSGLSVGQRVVIADLSQAVPTSTTTNRRGTGGLTGLTGGGGFGGGRFGNGGRAGR